MILVVVLVILVLLGGRKLSWEHLLVEERLLGGLMPAPALSALPHGGAVGYVG